MGKSKKDRMNFEKTLLYAPIKRKRTVRDNKFYLVPLPEPLKPTKTCSKTTIKTKSKFLYPEIDYQ